jgi:hypothetical protein
MEAAREQVRKELKLMTEVMFKKALDRSKESKKRPIKDNK